MTNKEEPEEKAAVLVEQEKSLANLPALAESKDKFTWKSATDHVIEFLIKQPGTEAITAREVALIKSFSNQLFGMIKFGMVIGHRDTFLTEMAERMKERNANLKAAGIKVPESNYTSESML